MISRSEALKAGKLAGEVLLMSAAKERVEEGYTRIDPIAIAEYAGVVVMHRPLEKLLGAFIREDVSGIILNSQRPVGMIHMTCAHELGHFYLGHGSTADEQLDYKRNAAPFEQAADLFAYSLIAPQWLVVKVIRARGWKRSSLLDPPKLYQLSLRLGLSYTATVWTLVRMNFLSDNDAHRLALIQPAEIKQMLLPAGTSLEGNQDVWHLGIEDRQSILEPRPTDRIMIDLPSHADAGFLWSAREAAELGFTLKPVTVEGARERLHIAQVVVQAPPTLRYELLMAERIGHSPLPQALDLKEGRPWEGDDTHAIDSLSLKAQVDVPQLGLSAGSRTQVVEGMQSS